MIAKAKRRVLARTLLAILGVAAAIVAGVLVGHGLPDSAKAEGCGETHSGVVAYNGFWAAVFTDCGGATRHEFVVDANGNTIPTDVQRPGARAILVDAVLPDGTVLRGGTVIYQAFYEGDTWLFPYCIRRGQVTNAQCRDSDPVVWRTVSPTSAPSRPLSNQPGSVQYQADANNRVVLGEDGQYYREWRSNGQWVRSTPYGAGAAALLDAQWNAFNRTRSYRISPTFLMSTTIPPPGADSTPPGQGSPSPDADAACEETFADLHPRMRDLICSGI